MPSTNDFNNAATMTYFKWLSIIMMGLRKVNCMKFTAFFIKCVLAHESSHMLNTMESVSLVSCMRHANMTKQS